ncbi:MAG TPA: YggT family protein [Candidatus Limnocylindria bacterium]|nr:YggT family protein [Candidatus Limnocylindria bacterium]
MALLSVFLEAFINVLAQALQLLIIVRVLLSWVPARLPWGLGDFVWSVTEPILSPIRRALPYLGGIDFSPFIALVAIQILESIALRVLPPGF